MNVTTVLLSHQGDPRTTIRGDVSHGVFVGTITTPDEDYHIEPVSHHFKEEQPFHSVIYRGSDVRYDAIKGQPCGLSDHTIIKKMAEDQKKTTTDATIAVSSLVCNTVDRVYLIILPLEKVNQATLSTPL